MPLELDLKGMVTDVVIDPDMDVGTKLNIILAPIPSFFFSLVTVQGRPHAQKHLFNTEINSILFVCFLFSFGVFCLVGLCLLVLILIVCVCACLSLIGKELKMIGNGGIEDMGRM